MDPALMGAKAAWQSIKSTAKFNPNNGLEKEFSRHVEEWGPVLEVSEVAATDPDDGKTYAGHTFLKVGVVIWRPEGHKVLGWLPLPQ